MVEKYSCQVNFKYPTAIFKYKYPVTSWEVFVLGIRWWREYLGSGQDYECFSLNYLKYTHTHTKSCNASHTSAKIRHSTFHVISHREDDITEFSKETHAHTSLSFSLQQPTNASTSITAASIRPLKMKGEESNCLVRPGNRSQFLILTRLSPSFRNLPVTVTSSTLFPWNCL